jgi:hypothetical protein
MALCVTAPGLAGSIGRSLREANSDGQFLPPALLTCFASGRRPRSLCPKAMQSEALRHRRFWRQQVPAPQFFPELVGDWERK